MYKVITSIFLFLIQANLFAQSDTLCKSMLTGKIIDEHDKSPVEFANIYILEIQKGGVSDSNGFYKIENICDGNYTIKISHVGCSPIETKITVKGKTTKKVTTPKCTKK